MFIQQRFYQNSLWQHNATGIETTRQWHKAPSLTTTNNLRLLLQVFVWPRWFYDCGRRDERSCLICFFTLVHAHAWNTVAIISSDYCLMRDLLIVETHNTKRNKKQTKTVLIRYLENPTPTSWCGMDSPHRRPVMQKGFTWLSSSYFATSVEPWPSRFSGQVSVQPTRTPGYSG